MESLLIKGGQKLQGTIEVTDAEQAILPMQAAAVLAMSGTLTLRHVPRTAKIRQMNVYLASLGLKPRFDAANDSLDIESTSKLPVELKLDAINMVEGLLLIGPILARQGGLRITLLTDKYQTELASILKILRTMGVQINRHDNGIELHTTGLKGSVIDLDHAEVVVTASAMLVAVLAAKITVIKNAARDPEILTLANCLNSMGAKVHGAGTDTIRIQGVAFLHGATARGMSDRLEAGWLMIAAAITNGDVVVTGTSVKDQRALIDQLEQMGNTVIIQRDGIRVLGTGVLLPSVAKAGPYPALPRQVLPALAVLQLLAHGTSITQEMSSNTLNELRRLGAHITMDNKQICLHGPTNFSGGKQSANDLFEATTLLMAGLATPETTLIENLNIDEHYRDFIRKLQRLGAFVQRKSSPSRSLSNGIMN